MAAPEQELVDAALLAEPVRRALYLHLLRQEGDVSRDDAARAVGIGRPLAAFHLDKLAAAGLLETTYRRLSGRTGPGAGRPSKLYRRGARPVEISVPTRRYALIARVLADALRSDSSPVARRALLSAARSVGKALVADARAKAARWAGRDRALGAVSATLERLGYEPYRARGAIRLRNCPFDAVARDHRDVVCRANVGLISGVIDGLGARDIEATFEPAPGECCVAIRRRGAATG